VKLALIGVCAWASTAAAAPTLVALAPGAGDDARQAVAIGPGGDVYAPDGHGAWVHRAPVTTADPLTAAGRAGDAVVALGDGVVYRLADNGWSALRLVQHGKAVLGAGPRALAAIGRQVFALDALTQGEPTKLVTAPGNVVALAAGARGAVIVTDTAAFRVELAAGKPGKLAPLHGVPHGARWISDRWAIVDRGAIELATGKLTRWPTGLAIGVAAATADDALVAVATTHAGLELVTVRGGAVTHQPITAETAGAPAIGVVVDRAGRAAVALADGRIAVRDQAAWTIARVSDEPPPAHPGVGPALQ
jgi:hypothetical protein